MCKSKENLMNDEGHCWEWVFGDDGARHRDHDVCCVCGEIKNEDKIINT